MFSQEKPVVRNTSSKEKLSELNTTTDVLVFGSSSSPIKERDKELNKLVTSTLKSTIQSQFGNTNKPLEYFSLTMLNNLWSKTTNSKNGGKKRDFEDVLKQYVQDNQSATSIATRMKYNNYRDIYSHIPAAHVALNIYKSSILSPEALSSEPINFRYEANDDDTKKIIEQRVKHRVIDKYKLNDEIGAIVKEALIDGVSYRALLSIEKDLETIMRDKRVLNEEFKITHDENYVGSNPIKFYDSEISDDQVKQFNEAIKSVVGGYINLANDFLNKKGIKEEESNKAKVLIENAEKLIKTKTTDQISGKTTVTNTEYSGAQIGRFVKDLINDNVKVKSKFDFMEDYISALSENFLIDTPRFNLTESMDADGKIKNDVRIGKDRTSGDKDVFYLNGSKILRLEPDKVTPLRIGGIVIGYIYVEREQSGFGQMTSNAGPEGTAGLTPGAPVNYGVGAAGSSGLNGISNDSNTAVTNPLTMFGTQQAGNDAIVDLFINGLGKKLNKNFIKNNKDLKELIHELLREKYITQRKVSVTFFSSDDVIETRVKPLFEGSEFFAKLYLAELTNNITISLGRGMDRRMIKVPFGLDDDMYQTVQDAIRAFKTREFSVATIDESTITSLIRLSPGRYEDMIVPIGTDGMAGYDIDILPGQDNTKSSELLPLLKNQFLDSINIPASAIDSTAEADFSRSIALRNIYFAKEIVDYQKVFNETITQIIRKIYDDEYKYIGDSKNSEDNISLDSFKAEFTKPSSIDIVTTLETMQNVDLFANTVVGVIVDMTDPSNAQAAHALRKKIFHDKLSYLPWNEWEEYYENSLIDTTITKIKKSGKKGSPLDPDPNDPNNFNLM